MTLDCDLDLAVAVTGHAAAYDVCRGVHSVDLLQTMSLSYSVLVVLHIASLVEQTVDLAMFQNMAQEVVRSRDQAAGMKQSLAADVDRYKCWG